MKPELKQKALNVLLIVTSLFGYLEWGNKKLYISL
jgi:hypothetical protein